MPAKLNLNQQQAAAEIAAGSQWKIVKQTPGGTYIHATRSCQTDVYYLPMTGGTVYMRTL